MTTRMTTLGEVVARTGGVLQTGPFGSQLHASDYSVLGTPLIMPVNLGDNEINDAGIARVGSEHVQRLRRHTLREGDIVFSRRGDVGRRSIVRREQTGWLCGTGCLAARFGRRVEDVNPAYVALYIGTDAAQTWLLDNAVGGTMPNLNTSILAALPIWLPHRREQDRAVDAISGAEAMVTTLERQIAKKQAIKQGVMQQLLTGDIRLPNFRTRWSTTTVGEVSDFMTGYPFKSDVFATTGIRLIRGSNVKRGEIDWSSEIAKYWATTDPELLNFVLRAGDIVIAMDGALVGRSFARVTDAHLPAYLVQRVARLRGKTIDQDLLYQWVSSRDFAKHVDNVKTHSAIPHISPRDIRDFKILVPIDVNEQRAIAEVLGDMDLQIELLKSRLAKARAIKTGMMQQLLTGRLEAAS